MSVFDWHEVIQLVTGHTITAETTGSDILDHVLVAFIPTLPILGGLYYQQRRQSKIKEKVEDIHDTIGPAAEAVSRAELAASKVVDTAHVLQRVEQIGKEIRDSLSDHLANSDEFWEEQRKEMAALATALGEHIQDGHHHHNVTIPGPEKVEGRPGKPTPTKRIVATSEPLRPVTPRPRSARGRGGPKASAD